MTQEPDPKVRRISFRLTNLPSLPEVVTKVLSLSEKTASTKEFADLIATDQGLAAKVLRLINSAFYSLRSPVSSLRHASALLGVRTLKSMALSVSAIHLFRRPMPPYDPTLFWRHCLAVALAGPKIARKFGLSCLDEIYVAGLLHDVGGGLFMQHYPRDYAEITLPSSEGTPEALAREEEKFGQSHPELAYTMAVQWRLSELVSLGLRHHHTPLGALPTGLLPDARGLIQVLQLADDHARRSGYSFGDADRLDPAQPRPELGLQPGEAEVLVGDLQKTIEELESLYLGLEKAPGVEVKTPDHQRS